MLPRAVGGRPFIELQVRMRVVEATWVNAQGGRRDELHAGVNSGSVRSVLFAAQCAVAFPLTDEFHEDRKGLHMLR